jgi:uncharacterized membrane protein YjdF
MSGHDLDAVEFGGGGRDVLLLIFAGIGFLLGRWLGMARRGFATMGAVSIGAAGVQIAHVATTVNRSDMTLLPIVIGAVIVAAMLLGALTRRPSQSAAA